MKSTLLFILLVCLVFPGQAQYSKEIKASFLDGEYFLAMEAYEDALAGYQKVYKVDPDNANINYRIGLCYLNIPGQKDKAIPYLQKATENVTENYREGNIKERNAPQDVYFFLGNAYHLQYNLEKARENYEKYFKLLNPADSINRTYVSQQIAALDHARQLMEHPVYYQSSPAGTTINTSGADFDPVVSADESVLVYITSLKFYDALFFTRKTNVNWTSPLNITPQVQSDGDLYPTGLSPDGKILLMSRNDKFNSDIWVSYYRDNAWTKAKKLGKNINTKYWESSASFSPDGKELYFTSNRKESIGGLDIFVSQWDEINQEWGPASNLGSGINTPLNEETPYLTTDGKTLFFSSQGYNSMGGFDIFHSTLREDGSWSAPQNLGYPINTTDDDLGFVPVSKGEYGYYSTYDPEQGTGDKDIFRFEIFSASHPRPVKISGTVTLANLPAEYNGVPKITLIDKKTGTPVVTGTVSRENGNYSVTVTHTGDFEMKFTSDQYKPESVPINIPSDFSIGSLHVNAELHPEAPVVETVLLPVIFFDFDKASIGPDQKEKTDHLARILKQYPSLTIELLGYTDAKGNAAYNKRLSLRRANAVKQSLVDAGVEAERVRSVGMGENDFIARNTWSDGKDCPEGRALNRRVAVRVTKSPGDFIKPEHVQVPDQLKIK